MPACDVLQGDSLHLLKKGLATRLLAGATFSFPKWPLGMGEHSVTNRMVSFLCDESAKNTRFLAYFAGLNTRNLLRRLASGRNPQMGQL